jgi:hypothetical protein
MFDGSINQPGNLRREKRQLIGGTMICPHCTIAFHLNSATEYWLDGDTDSSRGHYIYRMTCPQCQKMILILSKHRYDITTQGWAEPHQNVIYPKHKSARKPCPPEVQQKSAKIADTYQKACLCLDISPEASAALSRRCLQQVLRDNESIPKLSKGPDNNLTDEIKHVIGLNKLSSTLAGKLDYVRHVGNFAAHPTKDINTGSIVDVEAGEADYNLDVLEDLFEFYYVEPVRDAQRKQELNKKLASAGKKPMP